MNQQVNLFRPIFRRQEKRFSARAMLHAGALMVAGIALLYGVLAWQVRGLHEEARLLDRQYAAAAARLESITRQFGAPESAAAPGGRVAMLERQLAARRRLHQALRGQVFPASRGYSDYLLAFARQDLPELWLTELSITGAGEELVLRGRTADPVAVPRYVQRLATERVLAGKQFGVFLLRDQGRYADFELSTRAGDEAARRGGGSRQ